VLVIAFDASRFTTKCLQKASEIPAQDLALKKIGAEIVSSAPEKFEVVEA